MSDSLIVEGVKVQEIESALDFFIEHLNIWSDIQDHLPRLAQAARGNVVEIGVRSGVSTSALLAGVKAHGGHVWSIDIEPCLIFPKEPNWTFIQGDSATVPFKFANETIDVLFIDGDHSYDAVTRDLERFGPHAKKILLHDTDSFHSVRDAIIDFVRKFPQFSAQFYYGSYGMAELDLR